RIHPPLPPLPPFPPSYNPPPPPPPHLLLFLLLPIPTIIIILLLLPSAPPHALIPQPRIAPPLAPALDIPPPFLRQLQHRAHPHIPQPDHGARERAHRRLAWPAGRGLVGRGQERGEQFERRREERVLLGCGR